MDNTNIQIYPSTFRFDSQILRDARALISLGLFEQVVVVSVGSSEQNGYERISKHIQVDRIKLWLTLHTPNPVIKLLAYVEFVTRVYIKYRKLNIRSVSCHSCMVLPAGALLSRHSKNVSLVYSPHEFETERSGIGTFTKLLSRYLESSFIHDANAISLVSPSILEWYKKHYGLNNVYLLRNVSGLNEGETYNLYYRNTFKIPDDALIFLYHGSLGYDRGIDIILDVFSTHTIQHHVIFMGFGNLVQKVSSAAEKNSNIHYMPAVPPDEIVKYAAGADIGLCLIENTCLSNYYCLPNKLFEYLDANLPVVVSNFPDLENCVTQYNCGWSVPVQPSALRTFIHDELSENQIDEKMLGVEEARNSLSWKNEQHVLVKMYQEK